MRVVIRKRQMYAVASMGRKVESVLRQYSLIHISILNILVSGDSLRSSFAFIRFLLCCLTSPLLHWSFLDFLHISIFPPKHIFFPAQLLASASLPAKNPRFPWLLPASLLPLSVRP